MLLVGAFLLAVFVLPSPWGIVVVVAAAVVEVAETAFWIHLSRRRRVRVGVETMVGLTGEVVTACRPEGQVRVGGELWRARCADGAQPGETVRIRAVDGLTLVVDANRLTP